MTKATVNEEIPLTRAFDPIAETYDQWYDSPEGRAIFDAEAACLGGLGGLLPGRWLEVGVVTGRFASRLRVSEGIDPSSGMLEIAARRDITTYLGDAEDLPFPESSFDGVLMALALCFVADPPQAVKECCRVLRSEGRLLVGMIPADSPWGRKYMEKASKGHPIYARAHFHTATEIVGLAERIGFALLNTASALFWKPDDPPCAQAQIKPGIVPGAGFLGLLFEKTVSPRPNEESSEGVE